jgi:glycosyltransferase involved in cell wall biosynthesis
MSILNHAFPQDAAAGLELSVVMPCLNEAETLRACIEKAQQALLDHHIAGEVLVADNGSTDGSKEIAQGLGARLINVEKKGYGNALMGGILAARGKYVVMGDADQSYDFAHIPRFLEKLRQGFDLVLGNRFKGGIAASAMPPLHRYFGNPALSWASRLFFRCPTGDIYCGLRGFSRDAVLQMDLRTTGMEFAVEMVVKATLLGLRIGEVPTTLSPDGRSRPPHLRTWLDGWRTIRFMLLYSPRWLFFYPGALLILFGMAMGIWLYPGPRTVGNVTFDAHTFLYAAMAILIGFQAICFGLFARTFAITEGLLPEDAMLDVFFRTFTLETGLAVGAALAAGGLAGSVYAVNAWRLQGFGPLDFSRTLRIVIPSATAITLGFQTVLSSFLVSILGLARR